MQQSLADRVERGLEECFLLRAERRAWRSQAAAETDLAQRRRAELRAVRETARLQPYCDAVWNTIELSEKHGTLNERIAVLMLADAFFWSNGWLEALARGRDFSPQMEPKWPRLLLSWTRGG